jgi:uncharacterized protein YkwD
MAGSEDESMLRIIPCVAVLAIVAGLSPYLAVADEKQSSEKVKLTDEEQTILDLTNKEREKEKLPPLKLDATLCKVARAHSANMAKQEKLSHDLDCKGPSQRMKDGGYAASWGGENVANADGDTAASIFQMWMDSPLHKANILKDKYKEIGIGVARTDKGVVYYTQVFGTPKKR